MKNILVSGGCGYIGSHTVVELLNNGFNVIVVDNLVNSSKKSLLKINNITNKKCKFYLADIRNKEALISIMDKEDIDAVIHFAALKAVEESNSMPLDYYNNNVYGSICLIESMKEVGVDNIIFSSSATVYGEKANIPYNENMKLGEPSNVYGKTKVMIENILKDFKDTNRNFRAVSLRYFNPIGAHSSGLIGEDPIGTPNNLLPYLLQVAIGRRPFLNIYGNNYNTPDGTCRRDFLHVVDLAKGHLNALNWMKTNISSFDYEVFNLGTGKPVSVLEIVNSFHDVTGIKIPIKYCENRKGDLPEFWADPTKAKMILDWSAKLSLKDMINDSWRWQKKNPNGYE